MKGLLRKKTYILNDATKETKNESHSAAKSTAKNTRYNNQNDTPLRQNQTNTATIEPKLSNQTKDQNNVYHWGASSQATPKIYGLRSCPTTRKLVVEIFKISQPGYLPFKKDGYHSHFHSPTGPIFDDPQNGQRSRLGNNESSTKRK